MGFGLSIINSVSFLYLWMDVSTLLYLSKKKTIIVFLVRIKSIQHGVHWKNHMDMKVIHISYSCVLPVSQDNVLKINSFLLVFIADLLIYYPAVFYAYRFDLLNKNIPTKKVNISPFNFSYLWDFLVYCTPGQSLLSSFILNWSRSFSIQFYQSWFSITRLHHGNWTDVEFILSNFLYIIT